MKYNILIINWQDITNPLGGGAEVHYHEIFKRIAEKGHTVTLLCSKYPNAKSGEEIDGIHIIRSGFRNTFNFSVPGNYFHIHKRKQIDIVIDDINKIPFYTPLFVKEPVIGIIHHLFGSSIFLEAPLPFAMYVNFAEKLIPIIYKNIPMTVVSESTRDELIHKNFHKNKIHIIYNGVDTSTYKVIPENKNQTPLIGYLGRIKKYKSVEHLLKAFKSVLEEVPEAELVIMGDGDYLSELKRLTTLLQLEKSVTFTGSVEAELKMKYLNKIWFTVNPSPKEGWGLTVIESNACGVPVIAANSPGLRDSVIHNKTGILYPYGDCDQLAESMIKLITQNQLREKLSHNSIKWAQTFDWNLSADKMINLIQQTLATHKK